MYAVNAVIQSGNVSSHTLLTEMYLFLYLTWLHRIFRAIHDSHHCQIYQSSMICLAILGLISLLLVLATAGIYWPWVQPAVITRGDNCCQVTDGPLDFPTLNFSMTLWTVSMVVDGKSSWSIQYEHFSLQAAYSCSKVDNFGSSWKFSYVLIFICGNC